MTVRDNDEVWIRTENFISRFLSAPSEQHRQSADRSSAAGLPDIAISDMQGQQLSFLVKLLGARRILEIGTLGGYSAIWMAQSLPVGGRITSLEAVSKHARMAAENVRECGLDHVIEVRHVVALEELDRLSSERVEPFDFFFIDADQHNNAKYVERCLALGRPGSLIVIDNVVRRGEISDPTVTHSAIQATRDVLEWIRSEPLVDAAAFQTVGSRGLDGMLMIRCP